MTWQRRQKRKESRSNPARPPPPRDVLLSRCPLPGHAVRSVDVRLSPNHLAPHFWVGATLRGLDGPGGQGFQMITSPPPPVWSCPSKKLYLLSPFPGRINTVPSKLGASIEASSRSCRHPPPGLRRSGLAGFPPPGAAASTTTGSLSRTRAIGRPARVSCATETRRRGPRPAPSLRRPRIRSPPLGNLCETS